MNKFFGYDIEEFVGKKEETIILLSSYLNKGSLGLLLGAGVSVDLELPDWKNLVEKCLEHFSEKIDINDNTSAEKLKGYVDRVKTFCKTKNENYLILIQTLLYSGIKLNFTTANKNLLIALSSLIFGKSRGNVNTILTYNFDSIIEWYLILNGLKINNINKDDILSKSSDVEIVHLHGYLPHPDMKDKCSDFLIFSKQEFEDWHIDSDKFWKNEMDRFFEKKIFLSIGVSPKTLIDDVCPYLRAIKHKNESGIGQSPRNHPFGVAFIAPLKDMTGKIIDYAETTSKLLEHGIIPLIQDFNEVPLNIFEIVQKAVTFNYLH